MFDKELKEIETITSADQIKTQKAKEKNSRKDIADAEQS